MELGGEFVSSRAEKPPAWWFIFYIHPSVSSSSHFTHYSKGRKTRLGPLEPYYSGHFFFSTTVKHLCCFLHHSRTFSATVISACIRQLFIKKRSLIRPQTHTCRQTTEWRAQQNISPLGSQEIHSGVGGNRKTRQREKGRLHLVFGKKHDSK